MKKTLITQEKLKELGFTPCGRFWLLENKNACGSITYTEEIIPQSENGENSLDIERYYCLKLHNRKKQEIRFFTETLYVEDITTIMEMIKSY